MKISVSVRVERPIVLVWEGWNTPASIMAWNAASPEWHCPGSRVDLRIGGRFYHRMAARDGSMGFDFEGTFTEVVPPTSLGYVMDDGRTVRVRFVEEQGGTWVHEEFDAESEHGGEQQRAGWQSILDNFKRYMESAP
ncbi:SRPBCC family protein [Aeromonas media]|mgnify:FL=1|uniref:ATPase n=1 Tax=Aeromonas media TaxID=651 RepID=A0AAE6VPF6_AERME|nr:SRPBCC family protein [Aeromonas media]QHQ51453.1 ATPase [Aeromonas media]QQQ11786.1 SRPBCC family protein [Aeromonas media]